MAQRQAFLKSLTEAELQALDHDWKFWARPDQWPPAGFWRIWLAICGRGWGKTRVGAEWCHMRAKELPKSRTAIIAANMDDAIDVCIKGDSGILATAKPWFRPIFENDTVIWPNGSIAELYSAEVPGSLRGPQFHSAWCDELAKWRRLKDTWDMLRLALRLGQDPRTLITTTPTPAQVIRDLVADKRTARDGTPLVHVTRRSTYENAANLADDFLAELKAKYEGTRLGRQELHGEILVDKPGALWTLSKIEALRPTAERPAPTKYERVVVAIDPPVTSGENADECGIVVAAKGADGHAYVLEDASEQGLSPKQWAEKALACYYSHGASVMTAEVNNGGELVEQVVRSIDASVNYRAVRAHSNQGKAARAEPISALYEQGRVHHVGSFKALEDQMCDFTADFDKKRAGYSPDRVDALVWALTELMLGGRPGVPNIRRL